MLERKIGIDNNPIELRVIEGGSTQAEIKPRIAKRYDEAGIWSKDTIVQLKKNKSEIGKNERKFSDLYSSVDDYQTKYTGTIWVMEQKQFNNPKWLLDNFLPKDRSQIPQDHLEAALMLEKQLDLYLVETGIIKPKKIEERLENFVKELVRPVEERKSLESDQFHRLLNLFGASSSIDLLYSFRPEFKGVPQDKVKGIIAKYLGDFLVVKGAFNPTDIKEGIEYLSNPKLEEGLIEVIKESALSDYNASKKRNHAKDDEEIFSEYFQILDLEVEDFDQPAVRKVLVKVKKYYDDIFKIQKPEAVKDSLRKGRLFPDINQLINVKEIKDKKRMLIADDMGLGKSASAILSKETLGLKQALIVAPSNVTTTWERYLSDDEKNGYFKKGLAPKVLTVSCLSDLSVEDIASYQYIIISQERLTTEYTDSLTNINFDMLIVDEIHKLKNLNNGMRSANLVKLAEHVEDDNKYLALLSGTPVPNKIHDVAIILKLLYSDRFKDTDNNELTRSIINGDIIDLRNLLIPRMQMKSLTESIQMPDLKEEIIKINLSKTEHEAYEVLIDEDEIIANGKIKILRQFLLNPNLVSTTPGIESSKFKAMQERLTHVFKTKNKAVVFVNDYIEQVMRGDKAVFDSLNLEGVEIKKIMGGITIEERNEIQQELNSGDKRMLLIVNGQTADVGVDFSGAEVVDFYNEPWTHFDKRQQLARVYREGLKHDIESVTYITNNTIEEGMHKYIEIKQRAIEKLLKGIPISDREKYLLTEAEDSDDEKVFEKLAEKNEEYVNKELDVDVHLAEYYLSASKRWKRMHGYLKDVGEEKFKKFLADERNAKEYEEIYEVLGSRSYQANANRVTGTLIDTFVKESNQSPSELKILDMASGPEMLRKHILEPYQDRIISLDLNKEHFTEGESETRVVGSFLDMPFEDKSFDYATLSFAWHYTQYVPTQRIYERARVLVEANRVLKNNGRLIISDIYSRQPKNEQKLKIAFRALGFRVVDEYTSSEVISENLFNAKIYTLEKVKDLIDENNERGLDIASLIGKENLDGFKFIVNDKARVKDSKKIIISFEVNGKTIEIQLNGKDQQVLEEEQAVIKSATDLKNTFGSVEAITADEIRANGFTRMKPSKRYILFKRLQKGPGVVVIN